MDLRTLLPLLIIGGGFAFTGTILYGAWLLGRYRGREDREPAALADVEARLQRLELAVSQATDAVERLEASQRFTARLLTEGSVDRPRVSRVVTPH
jgi:hypothetical protein